MYPKEFKAEGEDYRKRTKTRSNSAFKLLKEKGREKGAPRGKKKFLKFPSEIEKKDYCLEL